MSKVAIVCDSTADLEPAWYAARGVTVVPLKVQWGDETHLDWRDFTPAEFFERLKSSTVLPKTSQPSPADFTAAYEKLAAEGAEAIVSIHLSAALSGTYQSASIAAETSPVPVHVIDTKTVTQATGLVVKAAVAALDRGATAEELARVATEVSQVTDLYFVLDTLDYLVKGGRAGRAQGLAAALLDIKVVLRISDEGLVEPFKKAKGRKKAFAELAEHVAAESKAKGRLTLAFLHAASPDLVDELKAALDAAGADYEVESIGLIGSVIGTYAGPRAVGVAFHPAEVSPSQ